MSVKIIDGRPLVCGASNGCAITGVLTYLAVPYTHPREEVRQYRFEQVNKASALLMNAGYYIFSPISMAGPIAMVGKLPTDFAYWRGYCLQMVGACKQLFVLQLEGWDVSLGVTGETKIADDLGLPVFMIDPKELFHEEEI